MNDYSNNCCWFFIVVQGFCCRCSFDQVTNKDDTHRGKLDCNPFGQKMSSGHCLRFSDTWWDLFDVEPATIGYQIVAEISGEDIPVTYNLTMDQSTPFFVNTGATLSGRIVGDFGNPTVYPNYESYYLAIKRDPPADGVVLGGVKNWMLIPRDMVDLSGTGCNKIGISFEGFYSQGSRCTLQAGSCLNNQLDDLFNSDEDLRSSNRTPKFMLQRWGPFKTDVDTSRQFDLRLLPRGITNTLLTLNIKADTIRFITNRSTGVIADATIRDFTTFSRDGIIYVALVNTGTITASYFSTVTQCTTPGVLPVPAQQMSMIPFITHYTQFQLYSQNLFSSTDSCLVSLYDSGYGLLDTVRVYFNTTVYDRDRGNQGGNTTDNPLNSEFETPSTVTCTQKCPSFWNVPCFIVTGCWINILWILLVVLAIILSLYVLWKTRCCIRPLSAAAGSLKGKKKKENDSPKKRSSKRSRKHTRKSSRDKSKSIDERPSKGKEPLTEDDEPDVKLPEAITAAPLPASPPPMKKKFVRPPTYIPKPPVFPTHENEDSSSEQILIQEPSKLIRPAKKPAQEVEMDTIKESGKRKLERPPKPGDKPLPKDTSGNSTTMGSASSTHESSTVPSSSEQVEPVVSAPELATPPRTPNKPKPTPATPINPFARQVTIAPVPMSPLIDTIQTPPRPRARTRVPREISDDEMSSESSSLSPTSLAQNHSSAYVLESDDEGALLPVPYNANSGEPSTPPRVAITGLASLPGTPISLPPPPVPRKPSHLSPTKLRKKPGKPSIANNLPPPPPSFK